MRPIKRVGVRSLAVVQRHHVHVIHPQRRERLAPAFHHGGDQHCKPIEALASIKRRRLLNAGCGFGAHHMVKLLAHLGFQRTPVAHFGNLARVIHTLAKARAQHDRGQLRPRKTIDRPANRSRRRAVVERRPPVVVEHQAMSGTRSRGGTVRPADNVIRGSANQRDRPAAKTKHKRHGQRPSPHFQPWEFHGSLELRGSGLDHATRGHFRPFSTLPPTPVRPAAITA